MTKRNQGRSIFPLYGKPAAALTAGLVFALSGNVVAEAVNPEGIVSAVPETGSWLIGVGVLAMLGFEFLRRRSALNRKQTAPYEKTSQTA